MAIERRGTAIETHVYNPRALITTVFQGRHNVIRTSDGALWAALQSSTVNLYLYKSTDEGFSWVLIADFWSSMAHYPRSGTNLSVNGPIDALMVCEKYGWVFLFHIRRIGTNYALYYGYCALDGSDADDYYTGLSWAATTMEGIFSMCHNKHTMYFLYTNFDDPNYSLRLRRISPRTVSISGSVTENTVDWDVIYDMCCNDDGEVFIVAPVLNGAAADTLQFVQYTEATDAFGTPVVIDTGSDTTDAFMDISIAIDGYGTLCVAWGECDAFTGSSTVAWRYATSVDKGLNWTKVDVANETGWTPYLDSIATGAGPATEYGILTDVIGGVEGGFLITYTQDNASNVPKALVRKLTTADGATYTLGDQEELANAPAAAIVPGAKFFDVAEGQLMNIDEAGLVRAAWVVGEGNNGLQNSSVPVVIDQDILKTGPYPFEYPSQAGGYTVESAGADELLLEFDIIDTMGENADYYAEGLIGEYTTNYYDTFVEHGTGVRVLQYEPLQDAQMGDRSAYGDATEIWANIFIDSLSYSNPQIVQNPDDTTAYVEKDIRKVYLPPDLHLSRSFILNKGNYLKRTVWLLNFGGNEYELTQVVPHFIDGQITHYSCNGYVLGPSHDPFARTVYPSET